MKKSNKYKNGYRKNDGFITIYKHWAMKVKCNKSQAGLPITVFLGRQGYCIYLWKVC